jgi:hypothetical protein
VHARLPRAVEHTSPTAHACVSLDYMSHSSDEEVAGWHGELFEQYQITGSWMNCRYVCDAEEK